MREMVRIKMKNTTIKNYISVIFEAGGRRGFIRTSDIAKALGCSSPTVTECLQKLSKEGFLIYIPYRGVKLTKKGRKMAKGIMGRYEVLERLLRYLNISRDLIENESKKLEPVMSDRFIVAIQESLDELQTYDRPNSKDPHSPSLSNMKNGCNDLWAPQGLLTTSDRDINTPLFNEFQKDHVLHEALCRSLASLLQKYMNRYHDKIKMEGRVFFHAASKNAPSDKAMEKAYLIPVRLTLYSRDDALIFTEEGQEPLLEKRIVRITNEVSDQGALLTVAEIAMLLGQSTETISSHIVNLEQKDVSIPVREK